MGNDDPVEVGSVHIPFDMCKYFRSICVDAHRTIEQVGKEIVQSKNICKWLKRFVSIQFGSSSYVSVIEKSTAEHVPFDNEVTVPETNRRFLQWIIGTDNSHATGHPTFVTVMLQAGTERRNGICHKPVLVLKGIRNRIHPVQSHVPTADRTFHEAW